MCLAVNNNGKVSDTKSATEQSEQFLGVITQAHVVKSQFVSNGDSVDAQSKFQQKQYHNLALGQSF